MHKFNKVQGQSSANQQALSLIMQLSTDFIEEDQSQYDKLCYQLKTLLPKQIEILRQKLIIIKDERLVDIATQWNTMSSDVKKMLRKLQMLQHYLMALEFKQQRMRTQILQRRDELTKQAEQGFAQENATNSLWSSAQWQNKKGTFDERDQSSLHLQDSMNMMSQHGQAQPFPPGNFSAQDGQYQQLDLLRMGNDPEMKDNHQLRDMQANIRMQAEIMQRQDLIKDRKQRMTAMNNMMSELEIIQDNINTELRNQGENQINPLEAEMDQVYINTRSGTLDLVDRLKKEQKSNHMLNYCFCGWLLFTILLGMVVYTEIKDRFERRRIQ